VRACTEIDLKDETMSVKQRRIRNEPEEKHEQRRSPIHKRMSLLGPSSNTVWQQSRSVVRLTRSIS
jgi:UDP-N-acetylmuramyl pentapeptide phosphotransferase/UDP-N-acetylglucosamine-1-phosphate transferase